ncbi:2-oxoacid:acceptor oxidoreductase subunit alpha [Candidatus Thorarchaeota archaeon]|nr:MAG: 2-oxoacid:acceptor oxidoreductase subunit alpha [Candidatus Thorarchaeota archaeon]
MSPNVKSLNFWQGNQACAEAAIAAGCRFFAGYPITPASEIAEIMSQQLPKIGGTYVQMEDEIAAISAVIGSAWGGSLSMTATSGPGFSLMQENIGYAIMTETPCVIVDVQRAGPSTGQATKAAQGDLMQARWGTHGDHEMIVLAPNSSQETYELTLKAFSLSEKLRHPVILLSDEVVGHSREKVVIDPQSNNQIHRRLAKMGEPSYGGVDSNGHAIMPKFGDGHNLLITGSTHDERGFRKTSDSEAHDRLIRRITAKIQDAAPILNDFEISGPESAEWGIISFGSTSRSVEELMTTKDSKPTLRTMRLKTVWPFPDQAIREFSKTVDKLLVPELNLGQMSREVSRVVRDTVEVIPLNKIGGGRMIEPDELLTTMVQS